MPNINRQLTTGNMQLPGKQLRQNRSRGGESQPLRAAHVRRMDEREAFVTRNSSSRIGPKMKKELVARKQKTVTTFDQVEPSRAEQGLPYASVWSLVSCSLFLSSVIWSVVVALFGGSVGQLFGSGPAWAIHEWLELVKKCPKSGWFKIFL